MDGMAQVASQGYNVAFATWWSNCEDDVRNYKSYTYMVDVLIYILTFWHSGHAANTFAIRMPPLAARVLHCQRSLEKMGYPPEISKPMFGLWYNYCINGARPGTKIEGVSCYPHTDGQNLALMMCVLFIYGKCILFWHSQYSLLTIG